MPASTSAVPTGEHQAGEDRNCLRIMTLSPAATSRSTSSRPTGNREQDSFLAVARADFHQGYVVL